MCYDITFCSKTDCKNHRCERNQCNIPESEYKVREIWIGDNPKCEYWEENNE